MNSKNDSRDSILATATRLFHLQGYHATGLNQILKESGAPKGSLYYHFPNGKEQLAIEAVHRMAEFVEADILKSLNKDVSAVTGIQNHILKMVDCFNEIDTLEGIPIGIVAAETSLISEPLRLACQAAFEKWEETYRICLIKEGFELEHATKLSMLINSMIEGAITRCLTNKNGQPLQVVAEYLPILLKK
ncbi:TetR/AcrR family transcriptional regulator [Paenibacillus polygoni]|uniref:TetR/AcrR family transcriptional regulator n=1 Tax=Paenibacillus polygoni TaxID=3050112 RepID=A0ABY8X608_9BACL|nr:TetR/AcrR family transcriptional regulator [Paenibacillus polygoni]WIV19658.1 TetR/AcrR family transcriptional regulator [Paenibacillus polygoni]